MIGKFIYCFSLVSLPSLYLISFLHCCFPFLLNCWSSHNFFPLSYFHLLEVKLFPLSFFSYSFYLSVLSAFLSRYTCKDRRQFIFPLDSSNHTALSVRCSLIRTEMYYHLYVNNLISRKFKLSLRRRAVSISVLLKLF